MKLEGWPSSSLMRPMGGLGRHIVGLIPEDACNESIRQRLERSTESEALCGRAFGDMGEAGEASSEWREGGAVERLKGADK